MYAFAYRILTTLQFGIIEKNPAKELPATSWKLPANSSPHCKYWTSEGPFSALPEVKAQEKEKATRPARARDRH